MSEGDILHYILILDAGVAPTISLVSTGDIANSEEAPDAVVALDASDITTSSFTANWHLIENASAYYLDVATDSAFTSMVAGYNNLSVGYVKEYPVVGLTDAYTYYYRVRGANHIGTGDSSNTITTTTDIDLVTDFDGNVYTYVTIGTQQWMVENFRSTHYDDGTAIPNLTLDADWISDTTGAYCAYDNDPANVADYGLLYNWYAVDNASGLAPTGWRVPDSNDINTLITFIGGNTVAGGILKDIGLTYWQSPNTGALNTFGFTAKGSGQRIYTDGSFIELNQNFNMHSSDDVELGLRLFYDDISSSDTSNIDSQESGWAVRMMRDV